MRDETFMTTDEVAERVNVPVSTLRYWRFMGQGPKSFTLGQRAVRYRASDVDAWLESQYQSTAVSR